MRNKQPSCKDADSSRLAQDKERKGSLIMTAIIIEAIVLVQTSVGSDKDSESYDAYSRTCWINLLR
ncbi:hypothetical protein BRADI_2g00745v3 [Brachypodium distachyon]|uniref:Uncharacterized protein n=1 Tax=Brachypodium distachyon TaxID=15368 RepID=A0A2K2D6A5_BRADI|nr:hypothetical protein BRADI_2g00745v3 [Brachypodium distachyon]